MGEKIGRKERKKKVKSTKQKERKGKEGEGGGEEDRMKNRKEKRVGIKYLNKRNTVLGMRSSSVLPAYFKRTVPRCNPYSFTSPHF